MSPRKDWPHEVQVVIDHLPAMVAYWDRDLRNVVANAAYMEWFGRTPDEMRGMHIADLLGPELYEKNRPYMEGALAGEPQLFYRTLVDTGGRTRETQASYIPDVADGAVRGFVVLVTDVTPRVEIERELQQTVELYRALVRHTPGGFLLLFDRDLRFRVVEGTALEDLGYGIESVRGRTLAEVVPESVLEEIEPHYRAALAGATVSWERRVGRRFFRMTAGPVRDVHGAIFAGLVSGTEITSLRQRQALSAALNDIATAVARQTSPSAVFQQVAESVRDLLAADRAAVARYEPEGRVAIIAASPSGPSPIPDQLTLHDGTERHSAIVAVHRTGRPALVSYVDAPEQLPRWMRSAGLHGGAAAPIRVRDRLWGALVIAVRDPEGLDEDAVAELSTFAELVELAVGNAQAWEELALAATTDPLTGLANHRSFQERLHQEVALARRHHRPLSLVLLDLDHFKDVNDTHGHQIGDQVLVQLAERLRPLVRDEELLGRLGGEEFGWILPESDADDAVLAAERMRAAIGGAPFLDAGTVTVSAGIGELRPGQDPSDLIAAADRALYAAKRLGRDRVERAPGPPAA